MKTPLTYSLYAHPFSAAYWREAGRSARSLRLLVFAALMIAMTRALSLIPPIPIFHTVLSYGFVARSLCALVCGPVIGSIFAVAEDLIGFAIQPGGSFFLGYTLSTVLGMIVYALCFYRARITPWRVLLANTVVNIFVNAMLGALWSSMMMQGPYWGYFTVSLWKNVLTIVPKSLLLYIVYRSILPVLAQMGLIPVQFIKREHIGGN